MKRESIEALYTKLYGEPTNIFEMNSMGLGDTIYKVTYLTGIKWLYDKLIPNCGCSKRQDLLNRWVPYFKTMTEEQQKVWEESLPEIQSKKIGASTAARLHKLHYDIFGKTVNSKCTSCGRKMIADLGEMYMHSATLIFEMTEDESEETEVDNSGEEVS